MIDFCFQNLCGQKSVGLELTVEFQPLFVVYSVIFDIFQLVFDAVMVFRESLVNGGGGRAVQAYGEGLEYTAFGIGLGWIFRVFGDLF